VATILVHAGDDLQAAINAAAGGDILELDASATFTGNYYLPIHSGAAIIIQSGGSLPSPGVRVTPATAAAFAKIQPASGGGPAFATVAACQNWTLLGLELLATPTGDNDILTLGDGSSAQNTLASVPSNLVVDRCYIHGDATYGQKRGISLQSATTTIKNCYISDIKKTGQDAQAIAGWNGPGPWTIDNCYLEATTENFLVGGATIQIPDLLPTDITFTNNTVTKLEAWRGAGYNIKNLLELKTGVNVLIDTNDFSYNWGGEGQSGYALVFTVRNEEGDNNWATIQNVTCTNNTITHSGSLFNILGKDDRSGIGSVTMNNLVIRDNVAYDINGGTWTGAGHFAQIHSGNAITIDHNTVINSGTVSIYFVDAPNTNFTLTNNIFYDNGLAIFDTLGNLGTAALTAFAIPYSMLKNVLILGAFESSYPADNFFPATEADVEFTDSAANDYELQVTSPYHNAATDGDDIGARFGSAPPTTLPGAPTTPSPADGAIDVAIDTDMTWVTGGNTDTYDVAFGFTISPPTVSTGQAGTTYTFPSLLINGRTYYWRITATNDSGSTSGPLWSFTTIAAPPTPSPVYHLRDVVRRRLRRAPIVWKEDKGIQTRVRVNLFAVDVQPGVGTSGSPDPMVMVRASRDGGRTWGSERQLSAGRVGRYVQRLNAWQWGSGRQWVFEISCTDPVLWNVVGAYLDAEGGTA
jgi:hypothetical protein